MILITAIPTARSATHDSAELELHSWSYDSKAVEGGGKMGIQHPASGLEHTYRKEGLPLPAWQSWHNSRRTSCCPNHGDPFGISNEDCPQQSGP